MTTADAIPAQPAPPEHTMQCMEVWGGNQAAQSAVKMPGLDVWVYSRPHQGDAGGGDVHYVSRCGTGRIARLLVADVSGHGRAVSDIAVSLRNLMRRFVNYLDQSRFVESLNREFAGTSVGGNFATAVVGTYWAPTQYLVTCNAGHPRPFHYRAATGTWDLLHADDTPPSPREAGRGGRVVEAGEGRSPPGSASAGPANLPLGIVEPTRYDAFGIRLERSDLVLIYTDSLVEARAADGTLLGEQGLLGILARLDARNPERLIPALLDEITTFTGGKPPDDDVTAMLLRNTAAGAPRMTIAESANAIWLFLGLVISRLTGGSTPIPWPELRLENIGGALFPRLSLRWGASKPSSSS